jgi:hypothetical protein
MNQNSYLAEVGEDSSGQLVINLPPELLNQVGWDAGDELIWEDHNNGSWSFKKNEDSDNGSAGIG